MIYQETRNTPNTPPELSKKNYIERERDGEEGGHRERERREKMSEEKRGGRVMKEKKQRKEGGCGQTG